MPDNEELSQPMWWDCDWHDLVRAAESAGWCSVRELAKRSSRWQLGRRGRVWVAVEPLASPVASWLQHHGRGLPDSGGTKLIVPITLTTADLGPLAEADWKARSLLVRHAYAAAYSTLLTDEVGVIAEVDFSTTPSVPTQVCSLSTPHQQHPANATPAAETLQAQPG